LVALGLAAFPGTRVMAQRCVDACVAETAAVGRYFGFAPAAPDVERRMAPDFALTDANGETVQLSALRGRVVLVNFWATWCHPCRVEMPWFSEFQKKYGGQGLTVVGISLDEDGWAAVRPSLAKLGVDFRVAIGDDALAQKFGGIETVPTTFLIDREGRIAVTHAGLADRGDMEERIRWLLEGR